MVRNIFIDESARDVEDDWEEEQDEEDNDGEELNERVSVNQTSKMISQQLTGARWISVVDVIASAYAAEPATHSIGSSCVADGGTPHDQANIASGEITRPFATSIASKSAPSSHGPSFGRPGSSEASSSSLRTIELVQSKAPALSMPRPFVPLPHQYLYSRWLGPSETGQWHANRRGHTRIFKCGFEVLSLKTGYSGPGELPTVEEFQLFYTNHCPHLDTQEGLELLERTARLLLPPISPRERLQNRRRAFVRFCLPGDLVEARLGFHVGTVAFVVDVQDATVTALDVESCSEVTFLKDFLVFHNEAFTPMGDDAHRWLYRMTYGLELDVADKGTRALVEVDGQYRLIIAPTKDLKLLTEYMPLTGADVSRLVGSHPHLSTIIPVTRFIGYRVTVIGTHHLKGSQGWLRAVSMDVAVCELDHSAVFSKATHQLHVDKSGFIALHLVNGVKLEDAIRPNRRGITMVYEKEGLHLLLLCLRSTWDPSGIQIPKKTNGCELSKWIEWFPALASALPTPGLLVKLEAPFIMFHGNPNVWRIMKLNGSAAPSLVYGVEGVFSFPIEHPTEVPPDSNVATPSV
ncbi:hypothetical protein BKA70DRAFT_1238457 [Coprinopsis sp. MPI-PUGE-AT-0042]|nr:hypothetical protein BKA70DRAFT_1238457 [Coprinopsis sp. MPI-PUGE-AT-0042]